MSWISDRRERNAFMRCLRITELEKSAGVELSYPELDLPTIRVVRNANDTMGWRPWVAVGFPGEDPTLGNQYSDCGTDGESRRQCEKRARERLWKIALARSEQPVEVSL